MDEQQAIKAYYVPLSSLKRAVELLETPFRDPDKRCKRNLALMQRNKSVYEGEMRQRKWRNIYQIALGRAIYSHRWDQVVYLLKKSPMWEHAPNRNDELHVYMRALTILLMNHPSAKAQDLLGDYVHMVLACRSAEDKKALYKTILSLTPKIYGRPDSG